MVSSSYIFFTPTDMSWISKMHFRLKCPLSVAIKSNERGFNMLLRNGLTYVCINV